MSWDTAAPLPVLPADPVLANGELTALDRCDRCGAQAWVRARMLSGELLLCTHHARIHRDQLLAQAVHLDDQSSRMP